MEILYENQKAVQEMQQSKLHVVVTTGYGNRCVETEPLELDQDYLYMEYLLVDKSTSSRDTNYLSTSRGTRRVVEERDEREERDEWNKLKITC